MADEENKYDQMFSKSFLEKNSEEDERLLEAFRKQLPSQQGKNKPLKFTPIAMLAIMVLVQFIKLIAVLLTIYFVIPVLIGSYVTILQTIAATFVLYGLKYWWKSK